MSSLDIQNLIIKYGGNTAVDNVDLRVAQGELLAILGPSGCGKSSLLSAVAGILAPAGGRIVLDDEVVCDCAAGRSTAPEKRNIGFVFQNYALWPHMSVEKNIAYPLRIRKLGKSYITEQTGRILRMLKLEDKRKSSPGQLSGGEQQRVALGRALIMKPGLLLLDEPLSNLDAKLREEMRDEIRRIQQEFGVTTLHVTHDQTEALAISDRIAVMERGRIVQLDEPAVVYQQPENLFTAGFVGTNNIINGRVVKNNGSNVFSADSGFFFPVDEGITAGARRCCVVRPENISIVRTGGIPSVVESKIFKGAHNHYELSLNKTILNVQLHADEIYHVGEKVGCRINKYHFIDHPGY